MIWPFKSSNKLELNAELPEEEQKFLAILAPSGLDWKTTRTQFESRYGSTTYHEWAKVIALPPTKTISKSPLVFYTYWNTQLDDLPPEYLFADYMPHKDVRKNHSEIESEIQAKLGEGERADVSNCLIRRWKFGIFVVEVLAWPPEFKGTITNTLESKNPELAFRVLVAIKSELSNIFPAKELLFLVDLINGKETSNVKFLRLGDKTYRFPSFDHTRHAYRNPDQLKSAMKGTWPMAWINNDTKQFGITGIERSLVMPFDKTPTKLINYKIAPARGSGGSELRVQHGVPATPGDGYKHCTALIISSEIDGMDDVAARLSKLWGLECAVQHGLDD